MSDPLPTLWAALGSHGWALRQQPDTPAGEADAAGDDGALAIVVNKVANGGWQYVRGAFADAILRARHRASARQPARPLAIVAAPKVSSRTVERLAQYRNTHAADMSWGAIDDTGRIDLHGVVEHHSSPTRSRRGGEPRRVNVWSDLGQVVLKVLVTKTIAPNEMWWIPSIEHFSGADLTRILGYPQHGGADQDLPSRSIVWQVTDQLRRDGFLDTDNRVLRVAELLETWRHRQQRPQVHQLTWPLPGKSPRERLLPLLHGSRACLAGYTACHERRIAIVPEGVFDIYVRSLDLAMQHGLVAAEPGERIDVRVRVAATPEAVFRVVSPPADDGATTADLIQCWLDLVDEPGRGREQADVIWRDGFHLP